jgi:hypothetical protein
VPGPSAAQGIRQESEGLPRDRRVDRSRILVQDLTQAAARVELVDTPAARSGAEAIYDKSAAVGLMYAQYLRVLTAAREDPGLPGLLKLDTHGAYIPTAQRCPRFFSVGPG